MKSKKNKDLESEIINDLLAEDKTIPLSKTSLSEMNANAVTSASVVAPVAVVAPAPAVGSGASAPRSTLASAAASVDETVRINESQVVPTKSKNATQASRSAMKFDNSVRTTVGGRFAIRSNAGAAGLGSEAALVQSENLRVAQQKIFELEEEIQRLRIESEQLAAAGDTIRKKADELLAENELKNKKIEEAYEKFESEKGILENALAAKDRELKELRTKNTEYEVRLSTNLQKIRVRERELENRLELVKMESSAIKRSKDETMLELKRQMDQLSMELESYRAKGQDLNRQISENQETVRRTVKALRLALSLLEGGSSDNEIYKKAK